MSYLDLQTIVRCLRVSNAFKVFIENERTLYFLQSRNLRESRRGKKPVYGTMKNDSCLEEHRFPHWVEVFDYFENQGNLEDLQEFVWFMKDYTYSEKDHVFYSPLHHAARIGSLKVLQYCLDHEFIFDHMALKSEWRAFIKREDYHKKRKRPLTMACRGGQTEAVRLILSYYQTKEIGIGGEDYKKKTAFHWACLSGNLDIVKMLLGHVKNPLLKTELTPIQIERVKESFERRRRNKEYFETHPWPCPNLSWNSETASKEDDLGIVLDDFYTDPNKLCQSKMTAFHYACREGQAEIVDFLIENEETFKVDIHAHDCCKRTGLHWACLKGKVEIVKVFVKHSATKKLNLNVGHYSGATPFIVACEENCIDVVKEFLQHSDINFNAKDNWGRTAFMKACMIGHVEIVKLLLKYKDDKIDINATDHKGRNVLQLITDRDHQEIEKILKLHFYLKQFFRK